MIVGTLYVTTVLRESHSLKDKRRILSSFKEQVRNRFNVSIAELEDQDLWQRAVFGVAVVSGSGRQANSELDQVVNFLRTFRNIELVDYEIEIL
ncbi:MAG: DUF503 domain-containing protein [Planctomycetes bacterium]|nr:DUF503 domain-containing protein [Planctomycetota bacterium]